MQQLCSSRLCIFDKYIWQNFRVSQVNHRPCKLLTLLQKYDTCRFEKFLWYNLQLNSIPPNPELINLLHRIHSEEIPRHLYRGYTILSRYQTTQIKHIQVSKRFLSSSTQPAKKCSNQQKTKARLMGPADDGQIYIISPTILPGVLRDMYRKWVTFHLTL